MSEQPGGGHQNRLIHESSPYLLQHASNPVDWYPWGDEAFARARAEDKPILLSIGYSACHWCHVMAHESFADPATARDMNDGFVNIKVDREERPDLDDVYMSAVQLISRHGGWPMTVFLTPDGEPFFGGTYFPPEDRHGSPSFRSVLRSVRDAYRNQRSEVVANARKIVDHVRQQTTLAGANAGFDGEALDAALVEITSGFDPHYGGFGQSPKFPSTMSLSYCLRRKRSARDREAGRVVEYSLERMAMGGIYDHIGGGFHRYSTDERWLIPHFEKMLYDNALLGRIYIEAWQVFEEPELRAVAEGVLGYVRREMSRPGGGFYATQDADSDGREGTFYVWTPAEIRAVLGVADGDLFNRVYDVTDRGNFEHGTSVLNMPQLVGEWARDLRLDEPELESRLASMRAKLLAARDERTRPHRDEKVIVCWNGLMISTMAYAARVLGSAVDLAAAIATAEFLWAEVRPDGRLMHMWSDGAARIGAYLDDLAALGLGYLDLYQATFDPVWVTRARALGEQILDEHEDQEAGGFFYTAHAAERLIARSKNPFDSALPGGNSLAMHLFLRLAALTGEVRYERAAERALACFAGMTRHAPQGFAHVLEAAEAHLEGIRQLVLAGDPDSPSGRALLAEAARGYDPNTVIALATAAASAAGLAGLVEGKQPIGGEAAAYLCRRFECLKPVTSVEDLREQLGG